MTSCGAEAPTGPGAPVSGRSPNVTQLAAPAEGADVSGKAAVWANYEGRLTWAVGTRVFATGNDSIIAELGGVNARVFGAQPRIHDLWIAWIESEPATGDNEIVVYDLASHAEWRFPNAAGVFELAVAERGIYWITPADEVARFDYVTRTVTVVSTPQPARAHLSVSGPWLTYAPSVDLFAYNVDTGVHIDLGRTDIHAEAGSAISSSFVVRRVLIDDRWFLSAYDLATGQDTVVPGAQGLRFDIDGDRLVYAVSFGVFPKEIWIHDLRSGKREQLADTRRFVNFDPKVSGDRVVWTQSDGSPPIQSAVMADLGV